LLCAWYAALGEEHPKWTYKEKTEDMATALGVSKKVIQTRLGLRTSKKRTP
jgi:hypothetical protein